MYAAALILFSLVFWRQVFATLTMTMRSAYVGRQSTLQCSNEDWSADPVTWWYQPDAQTVAVELYANAGLLNGRRNTCDVDTSTPGRYDLIIRSARLNDSGIYICRQNGGYGTEYTVKLIVIDIEVDSSKFTDVTTRPTATTGSDSGLLASARHTDTEPMSDRWWIFLVSGIVLVVILSAAFVGFLYRCRGRNTSRNSTQGEVADMLPSVDNGAATIAHLLGVSFWVEMFKMASGQRRLTAAVSERVRDIFALTCKPGPFKQGIHELAQLISDKHNSGTVDAVVSPESRGFIISSAVAYELGVRLIPVRVAGNLPGQTISEKFVTRKNVNRVLEIQTDIFSPEACIRRVVIVDDELASGGSTIVTVKLLRRLNVEVIGCFYIQELEQFRGREKLRVADINNVYSLVQHCAN